MEPIPLYPLPFCESFNSLLHTLLLPPTATVLGKIHCFKKCLASKSKKSFLSDCKHSHIPNKETKSSNLVELLYSCLLVHLN